MAHPPEAPIKGPSTFMKTTTLLNFLVNLISMGALIGVLAFIARVHAKLDDIYAKLNYGEIDVSVSQASGPLDVQLVNDIGNSMGTSQSSPIYVSTS
ncbi:hypothetical protein MRS44_018417 [Fusarium solani]|uniref:uncharacterized protein n=1 Tax=Fusarium solani TaxID=169388 RepID=UPI0032C3FC17|nr:hypothetical protein MRS44_018417 [Fusarium solani]